MLKQERQERIVEILEAEGRVVATDLQDVLGVSHHTVRRDLDELAEGKRLQRVHGGALARSRVPTTYEDRHVHGVPGKIAAARAAATLLEPGQVVILDGGSTALHLVDAIPAGHTGTFITHSPPVAAALGRLPGLALIVIGGTLDARAMVTVGAEAIRAFRRVTADICFLGVWSVHPTAGISNGYYEEAELRAVMLERADKRVGLASREKLGTVAPFAVAPATALTHIATEPGVPPDVLGPFVELGIQVLQEPRGEVG